MSDWRSAQRASRVRLHPLSDASSVEVVSRVARQGRDFVIFCELTHANSALLVVFEVFSVERNMDDGAQNVVAIILYTLLLSLDISDQPTDAW